MADQLPIISGIRAINASSTASTSLIGRGLTAIQSGKLAAPVELDEEKIDTKKAWEWAAAKRRFLERQNSKATQHR